MIRDINEEAAERLAEVNASLLEEVARLRARNERLERMNADLTEFIKGMAINCEKVSRAALEDGE